MRRGKTGPKRRSGCPLNASVEMLGDRWSLLIIRDMILAGARSYKQFLKGHEGIATNILADRLRKLVAYGIITTQKDPAAGRRRIYLPQAHGNGPLGRRARRHRKSSPREPNACRQTEVPGRSPPTLGQPSF